MNIMRVTNDVATSDSQGESQSKEEIQQYQNLINSQTFAYFIITGSTSMFLSLGVLLMTRKAKF